MNALRAENYRMLAARCYAVRDLLMAALFTLWAERLEAEAAS